MQLANIIVNFIRNSRFEDFPTNIIYLAKQSLLDNLGNLLGGFSTKASTRARKFASSFLSPKDSTLFGNEKKIPCAFAAFANSLMASDLDADDGHRGAMGHPGAAVITASLAVSEKNGLSGKKLIEAMVVGYEIAIRMGVVANIDHTTRFYGSGNWCSFGVTAAVSKLIHLKAEECLNALGICEAHSPMAPMGWMFSGDFSMTKEAIGWGALTGVCSPLLAKEGMTGTFSLADARETIMVTLGREYEFRKIYFKEHASCRYTHAAIDAILKLRKERIFRAEEIIQIKIGTFSYALHLNSQNPKSIHEAQYSIPFTVGAALVYGQVGPTEISEDKLWDERILAFAKKVHLYLDHDIQRSFPSSTLARVELILVDGTRFTVAPVPTRGDYQNPFTEEELEDKFRRYGKKLLKGGDINEIISLIKNIEQAENISKITERLNDAINNNLAKIR